jgi:hypothetical protein
VQGRKEKRETHPKRLRNPNISIRTPKKGYLRKTRAMPTTKAAAVFAAGGKKGEKVRQLPFLVPFTSTSFSCRCERRRKRKA